MLGAESTDGSAEVTGAGSDGTSVVAVSQIAVTPLPEPMQPSSGLSQHFKKSN